MKNNKGFIATAVLYSLIILLVLSLFIILKNLGTIRDVEKENGNDIKDDFDICDPENLDPVEKPEDISEKYKLDLELKGNLDELVTQEYTFAPCRIYYIELAGGQGGADTYRGGYGGYQFLSLRTTNVVTATLYAGGGGYWKNGGQPDGQLGPSSGGGGGSSSIWLGNKLLAAASGGGGGAKYSVGTNGTGLKGTSTLTTYDKFVGTYNGMNGQSYFDGAAKDETTLDSYLRKYGLTGKKTGFNAIESNTADGGGGGGGFPTGTNHYFHASWWLNSFTATQDAGDLGGSGGKGYNYLESTGNDFVDNVRLLKYSGKDGCNGRELGNTGSGDCSLDTSVVKEHHGYNGYIKIYSKKGSY